jgi:hypothetical protein
MPSDPIPIPKTKTKTKKNVKREWSCENNKGCMWSCPCDCNNCIEFNMAIIYKNK